MCTLPYGETSYSPCCDQCGAPDASSVTHLCKSCGSKAYYIKNRERIKAFQKEYQSRPNIKERRKQTNKAYFEANKAKKRQQQKDHSRRPGARFTRSKLRAADKGVAWTLTKQTYFTLIQMDCWYCGGYFQKRTEQTGIGLDRIDNAKGYVPGNVLSCCGACNLTRQNRWSVEQTRVMIAAVIEYNKLNQIEKPHSSIESSET